MRFTTPAKILRDIAGRMARARRLVLFLDYDGTLKPIAPRPEDAVPGRALVALMRRIARTRGVTLAIVTGRSIRGMRSLMPLRRAWYVGTHGAECARGMGRVRLLIDAPEARPAVRRILAGMRGVADETFSVEDKKFAVSLHYRRAAPGRRRAVCRHFLSLLRPPVDKGVLRVMRGKGAIEAKAVAAHKGLAVTALCGERPVERDFCIAIGDDRTDADLLRAVRGRGAGIAVGHRPAGGNYRLKDPSEVTEFLRRLIARWRRRRR
ncbi:MAG: trehalose-phosphatase [Candidatus Lindowbacteria bacterium RIFCSPLOWO2_12_FULL_62_27]|nr:MAG: trehalose-phosphatase [Candidatus Lindowbacteria bacterium RIFCSPLOWO2_12_FULL_62_27]